MTEKLTNAELDELREWAAGDGDRRPGPLAHRYSLVAALVAEVRRGREERRLRDQLSLLWENAVLISADEGQKSPAHARRIFARLVAVDEKVASLLPWPLPAAALSPERMAPDGKPEPDKRA